MEGLDDTDDVLGIRRGNPKVHSARDSLVAATSTRGGLVLACHQRSSQRPATDDALPFKLAYFSWAETKGRPNDARWSLAVNRLPHLLKAFVFPASPWKRTGTSCHQFHSCIIAVIMHDARLLNGDALNWTQVTTGAGRSALSVGTGFRGQSGVVFHCYLQVTKVPLFFETSPISTLVSVSSASKMKGSHA